MSARMNTIANRYAKAISASLADRKKIQAAVEELKAFSELSKKHPVVAKTLDSAALSAEKRVLVAVDLAKKLKLTEGTERVLSVLTEGRRIGFLDVIIEKLEQALLLDDNKVPIVVESPTALQPEQKQKVEKVFTQVLGKKVAASYELDPDLIGGLRVKSMGRTFDGSLSGWLQAYREHLGEEIARKS